MSHKTAILCALSAVCVAAPAIASSDYLLQLPPAKGEAVPPVSVESWSFGVCNVGQCSTSSTAKGGKPNRASWDLATNKGGRMASGAGAVPVLGDVDGDGAPDFAFAGTQDEIYGLSLTFQKITVPYQAACDTGHIDNATLSHGDEVYVVSNVSVVCSMAGGSGSGAAAASYAKSGITRIDSTPARISTNMTVGKQTQGATFGERCASGSCDALTDGLIIMRFVSGQMKHTKTGHVTLLK
jgi:hypothetical protein